LGGNKGRKLEFLLPDILRARADVVVTCGAMQSNFIRQLGAACSRFNIYCAAATMELPFEATSPLSTPEGSDLHSSGSADPGFDSVDNPTLKGSHFTKLSVTKRGNLIPDRILRIDLRFHPDGTWDELYAHAEALAQEFEAQGRSVYRIPIGGSSPLGACAFTLAAAEIEAQALAFDHIVFASSSGSTHTGLAYALHGTSTEILGIACDPEPEIAEDFAKLAWGLDDILERGYKLQPEDFHLDFRFVGEGYGVPSEAGAEAIGHLARTEGVFLDPIYTGKAFAGLMQLAKEGRIKGRVLFWHTGGIPALFA
jgi:1-aminocyclopropane-1-carboxylate deaminase/D-cysteine desulfhydrase-like pyridoxal-dependent ACC family enzyme